MDASSSQLQPCSCIVLIGANKNKIIIEERSKAFLRGVQNIICVDLFIQADTPLCETMTKYSIR